MMPTRGRARSIPLRVWALSVCLAVMAEGRGQAQLYRAAPAEVNARAEQRLRGLFAARTEARTRALFSGGVLICGPFLWRNLQNLPQLKDVKGMTSPFVAGAANDDTHVTLSERGSGKTFNTAHDIDAFRRAFLAIYRSDLTARIRAALG